MRLPKASHILTRPFFLFCTFALIASFFLPRTGIGVTLCAFYNLFGVPCFGCGMTRAMGNLAAVDFAAAWAYHPFALLLWPFMVFFGIAGIRRTWSRKLNNFIARNESVFSWIFWLCLAIFIAFGIWRMAFAPEWVGHGPRLVGD